MLDRVGGGPRAVLDREAQPVPNLFSDPLRFRDFVCRRGLPFGQPVGVEVANVIQRAGDRLALDFVNERHVGGRLPAQRFRFSS